MRKKIILICVLGFLITIPVVLYIFTNLYFENPDIRNTESDVVISSEQLIQAYHKNEKEANKMYREKIIEVDGIIKEVTFLNNRNTVILYGEDSDATVLCDMAPNQYEAVKKLQPDQYIQIKGICKGFLKDAILLNCILSKTLTDE